MPQFFQYEPDEPLMLDANGNFAAVQGTNGVIVPLARYDPATGALLGADGLPISARPVANTAVIFGDSITAQNTLAAGASGPSWSSAGYFTWANALMGGRLRCLNNAGVSGNTTAQMLARIETDVVAYRPGWVFVLGGTNDVFVESATAATIITRLTAIYTRLLQIGARVVAIPILPRTGLSAGQATVRATVNRWVKECCYATPGMVLADIGAAIADQSTNWQPISGATTDGLHPAPQGAMLLGTRLANIVGPLIPSVDLLPMGSVSDDNLLLNGALNGSAGSAPTSWGGTGTATLTYPARTDDVAGNWFQMAIANGANQYYINQSVFLDSRFGVGDYVYGVCEFQCDSQESGATANTQQAYMNLSLIDGAAAVTNRAWADFWDNSYANYTFPANRTLVLTTPAIQIPAGTARFSMTLLAARGGNFRWGRCAVRKGNP